MKRLTIKEKDFERTRLIIQLSKYFQPKNKHNHTIFVLVYLLYDDLTIFLLFCVFQRETERERARDVKKRVRRSKLKMSKREREKDEKGENKRTKTDREANILEAIEKKIWKKR